MVYTYNKSLVRAHVHDVRTHRRCDPVSQENQ